MLVLFFIVYSCYLYDTSKIYQSVHNDDIVCISLQKGYLCEILMLVNQAHSHRTSIPVTISFDTNNYIRALSRQV